MQTNTNYINFDPNCFDPSAEKVAFVTRFDDKYVYGFLWSYENSAKRSGFRMLRAKFESRYQVSPVQ
jgi:hypothetical protein